MAKLYTTSEAADLISINHRTVRKWIEQGIAKPAHRTKAGNLLDAKGLTALRRHYKATLNGNGKGRRCAGRYADVKWSKQSNAEVAEQVGVSVAAATHYRRRHCLAPPPGPRQRPRTKQTA